MPFSARRFLTSVLVPSLLIQMQIAVNGYAARRPGIAFTSTRDGNSEIYVMEIDGRNQVRLTNDSAIDSDPAWSPDGQSIAYESEDEDNRLQIYLVRADGSELPKRLTHNAPSKRRPAWSPDGGTIAYVTITPFPLQKETIHLMTAGGDYLEQLSEKHGGSDTEPDWFAPEGWSVSPAANFVTIWGEIKKPTAGR